MAFLIPLLLPHIVEAGANLGIGISNAIQGDHSSVSFQIGSKVFTSRKSFNFESLPPELRLRILLEALHESVSNLVAMIESKKGATDILKLAKTVTLREGFSSKEDVSLDSLESISILPDYPTPYHPLVPPIPAFTFGFQLIRTQKDRLKSLVYGLPLESTTNEASRQNLAQLRPATLTLSFVRPTIPLFKELEGLVAKTTEVFEIRYIPGGSGKIASPTVFLCDPLQAFKKVVIYLYLPRTKVEVPGPFGTSTFIPQGDMPVVSEFIASLISALEVETEEIRERYVIWRVESWETAGLVHKATKARLWPEMTEDEELEEELDVVPGERRMSVGNGDKAGPSAVPMSTRRGSIQEGRRGSIQEGGKERKHWDRETNLRLLGGLVNLRLESKKH